MTGERKNKSPLQVAADIMSVFVYALSCSWPTMISGGILTVLDLLAVPWGLLQGFDDQGGGRGHHRDGGHTVLDAQAHGDLQTLPVTGRLGDVVSDLLGRLQRDKGERFLG